EGSLQDATTALLNIRRELSSHGFRFPLFDFACIWYLHKARDLPGEQIKQFFPAQDLVVGVIDALTKSSVASLVKAVINLKADKLNTLYTVFKYKRALDEEQLEMIERMNVKRDLLDKLPEFFAADLNAAMKAEGSPGRVVLFFDTHEAFWGAKERDLTNDRFFYRDEWLRALLISLELSDGIVTVVAGRERPKWPQAALFPIPEKFLKFWLVGHLSNHDAATYLTRAGISDQNMQRALITYASSEPNEVHPFYLGLCVDIMEAAKRQETPIGVEEFKSTEQLKTKEQQLIERLLRYVDVSIGYAVRALSACRAFNMDIYLRLGREMNFNADAPSFEVLTNFSFVWKPKKEMVGWYRIHNLVRRLGRDNTDALVRRADEVLEAYYRERQLQGDESAIAEAIYHANQLDSERGTAEWVEVFNRAFEKSRYRFCAELLDVRQEMTINSDFDIGRVSQVEGEYFFTLSRYDNAWQEYMESIHAYDREISRNPDFAMAHNNKGITLIKLGELQAETAMHQAAAANYQEAIATFGIVLRFAPDLAMAHSNKGLALL
ncbi:MAG TPA: hypothetical protein VEQ40_09960, partial [Pyrinomonadaceae bacterium]|nr:hypothetical protein [Pyrinomonadaceae bacterium]